MWRIDRRLSGLGLALALLVLPAAAMAAELPVLPWEELPKHLGPRLIPAEDLGVEDCPRDVALRTPSRRVLQIIENAFYAWDEHDLGAGSRFCVVMRQPLDRPLTTGEAQVLLTASSLWTEAATGAAAGEILSPDDPRLAGAAASPPPLLDAIPKGVDERSDEGLVGWAGTAEGEPEGDEGASRPKAKPRLGRVSGSTVIGRDDGRTRVTGTTTFPFNSIAYLGYDTTTGKARATGFLVTPYMILTNGHVVWDRAGERFVRNMEIAPGQAQASQGAQVDRTRFGTRTAVRFATNPGWVATQTIQYDYSAAFIDNPFPGISTFMPLAFDVAPATGSTVHVAGYPLEVRGEETFAPWYAADRVDAVQGRVLRYKVDTTPGNSGSPVWEVLANGQRRVIAIHSTGDPYLSAANSGARLVTQNADLIAEWMQWRPQTRTGLQLTINQIDATDCPLIRAVASVINDAGQPVADLTRLNFTLNQNGVPQAISVGQGEGTDNPVTVALVLDASGSLSTTDVENAKAAARAFVDLLKDRDKASVFHFANGVARVQTFTSDKILVKSAINRLNREGGAVGSGSATALYDAIVEAAQYSGTVGGRRALVVMTDGQDNTGANTLTSAVEAARRAGIPVFTIGFGGIDRFVLDQIATNTGGRFFQGASSADLQAILRSIGRTLENQYVISWLTSFVSGGTERLELRVDRAGESDQETATYSQGGTAGCPPPNGNCIARLESPNGGEVWTKGRTQTIRWSTNGPSCGPVVGLGVSDGTRIWQLGDTGDDGSETFNIDFLPTGTRYQAIVVDRATTAGGFDLSDRTFTIEAPAQTLTCTAGPETLCLQQGRFQIRVLWRTPQGLGGFGKAKALTPESGYFWFFEPDNPEIGVKLLDARALNQHFWFFSGALTNLEYSVFLTDMRTGQTRVYTNSPGDFTSLADITAFGPAPEAGEQAAVAAEAGQLEEEVVLPFTKVVLWSQMDGPVNNVVSSENRTDPGQDSYDTEAADDFVVPSRTTWAIDGIDVQGAYYGPGTQGPAESVNVVIYADRRGAPGAVQCAHTGLRPRRGLNTGSFEIDLPRTCQVRSGRYWLAVQANQDFRTAGQWGWQERNAQREQASVWRNPGGGYGAACRSWRPRTASCGAGTRPDLLFQVRGQSSGGGGAGRCRSNSTTLCLGNNRFQATVSFKDDVGRANAAKAVSISGGTGYFWFFNANNPELLVKVLDARAANGNFWVFYGGMTSLEFTLTVTDTATNRTKTYLNRRGRFASVGDTEAFSP